ncbi:MAG: hypothetical protein ACTSXP_14660 [Promethearchaeota archaeon]
MQITFNVTCLGIVKKLIYARDFHENDPCGTKIKLRLSFPLAIC